MALKDHIITEAHVRIVETKRNNYELGNFTGKKDKFSPPCSDIGPLARAWSQDTKVLAEDHLSAAAYKLKYGLAMTKMELLVSDLQCNPF